MRAVLGLFIIAVVASFVVFNVAICPHIIEAICASNTTRAVITRATLGVPMVDMMCVAYDEMRTDCIWREFTEAFARDATIAQKIQDSARASRAYSAHATNLMFLVANCALAFYVMRAFSRTIFLFTRILIVSSDIVATICEFLKPGAITWVVTASSCDILRDMDNMGFAIYIAYVTCSNFSVFLALVPFITFAIFMRSVWKVRRAVQWHQVDAHSDVANVQLAQAA
jgi:hypothetical protein